MINSILAKRKEFNSKDHQITIHYTTINNYLRENYGKPRKIRKTFVLSNEQMQKKKEFCQIIYDKNIQPQQIFFSDESKIDLGSFSHDLLRLDPNKRIWDEDTYNLINLTQIKFEKSLMKAGVINFYGLSKLIFPYEIMNKFSYGQALRFYKEDIEKIKKENKIKIIFNGMEQRTIKVN